MPLYEYVCDACQHHWDERRSIHEQSNVVPCPNCKGEATGKKQFGMPAILSSHADRVSSKGGRVPLIAKDLRASMEKQFKIKKKGRG